MQVCVRRGSSAAEVSQLQWGLTKCAGVISDSQCLFIANYQSTQDVGKEEGWLPWWDLRNAVGIEWSFTGAMR